MSWGHGAVQRVLLAELHKQQQAIDTMSLLRIICDGDNPTDSQGQSGRPHSLEAPPSKRRNLASKVRPPIGAQVSTPSFDAKFRRLARNQREGLPGGMQQPDGLMRATGIAPRLPDRSPLPPRSRTRRLPLLFWQKQEVRSACAARASEILTPNDPLENPC
jgi:hypothetical protein